MKLTDKQKQFLDKLTVDADMQNAPLDAKVEQIIKVTSISCAAIALMPIPFADFPVLTAIECAMVMKLGQLYGFEITKERAFNILKELGGVVGLAWIGKNLILLGYKTVVPFLGGFFTVPMVFGVCYGMGKVASLHFEHKKAGKKFDLQHAKELFNHAQTKAKSVIEKHPLDKETAKELFQKAKQEAQSILEYVKTRENREKMVANGKAVTVALFQKVRSGTKDLWKNLEANKDKFFPKKKQIETADLLAVFFALQTGHLQTMDNLDPEKTELVLDAIRRSTTDLPDNASREEIADYLQQYSPEQTEGILNNIAGIYHELSFEDHENNDGDDIKAKLFEETNHPGSDAILINTETGEREFVQLKATNSSYYIESAMEKNPDIRIISTTEMAEKLGIESSGMSNAQLREDVSQVLDDLTESEYQDLTIGLYPMSFWIMAFATGPILLQYLKKEITKEECLKRVGKITGKKLAKYLCFVLLLLCPVTSGPTAVYLIIKYSFHVIKTYRLS